MFIKLKTETEALRARVDETAVLVDQSAGAGIIAIRQAADAARDGGDIRDRASTHRELAAALKTFKQV